MGFKYQLDCPLTVSEYSRRRSGFRLGPVLEGEALVSFKYIVSIS